MKIHIKGMDQIGDSIYSRPFVYRLLEEGHEVYITTSHPYLYSMFQSLSKLNRHITDPPTYSFNGGKPYGALHFIKPTTFTRRTAKLNFLEDELTTDLEFLLQAPVDIDREVDFHYNGTDLKKYGIVGCIEERFGFEVGSTSMFISNFFCGDVDDPRKTHMWSPDLVRSSDCKVVTPNDKPLAVIRPVTHRKEFPAATRSPEPHYVNWCARILRDQGYHVVSIADIDDVDETLLGAPPPAHQIFHRGELGIKGALALIQRADLVVGGSGFMIPACLALNTPMFIIFGGRGEYDNPQKVLDLRYDLKKVGWALPDNFCRCNKNEHDCDKTIRNLDHQFFSFMKGLT